MTQITRAFGLPGDESDPEPSARLQAAAVYYTKDQHDARAGRWPDIRGAVINASDGEALGHAPFPGTDNVMFGYLIAKAQLLAERDGIETALLWLGAHSWLEGFVEGHEQVWTELNDEVDRMCGTPSSEG